jgi:F0F1-type ATP synthase membrane subunit c/vacuolar-type H+-ATPase subunit K
MSENDLNAYVGISLGFLFTVMGTSLASVRATELIDRTGAGYLPLIMAAVLGVFGFIISVISTIKFTGGVVAANAVLGACLVSGFANLFSGVAMAFIFPKATEVNASVLVALVFVELIGLYGLVIGLIMLSQ